MIKTDRLEIRLLTPQDWQAMQNIAADFKRSEYAVYDMPLPVEEDEIKGLTEQFANTNLWFAVFSEDKMIGYICFHEDLGQYDLGVCFHSAYHGFGYALESCRAVMEYISKGRKISKFTAGAALKNIPSCKLLKKLGFELQKTEKLSFHKDQNGQDIIFEGGIFVKRG